MRLPLAIALALIAQPLSAKTLLIGNKGENTLSFVDLATGRELMRRETGKAPHEIAVSPDGKRAAVVAYAEQFVDIFDVASGEKLTRVDLAPNLRPHGLVWLKDGRLIATTEGSDSIAIVAADLKSVTSVATGQKASHMVAISPRAERAYVANIQSGSVTVIDLAAATKLQDVKAGTAAEGIALTPDGRWLWVADLKEDVVRVFDTRDMSERAKLATGKTPIRVAISPDGRTAVTSNVGAGTLSLFDTATLKPVRTITVSGKAEHGQVTILFAADGKRLYAAETGIDRIAEVDMGSGKVLGRLPAGKNGDGLAIAP